MLRAPRSATLILLCALVGCGAAAGSGLDDATGAESGDVVDSGDVTGAAEADPSEPLFTLPLDGALPLRDPMTAWRFDRALDAALARCVGDAGAALEVPDRPQPSSPWVHERRYGAMRPDDAARWGYRPAPVDGVDALLAAQAAIGPDARAALDGVGDEPGCLDIVGGEVALRDDPRWSSFLAVESMLNSTLDAAAEQAPVQEAIDRWSDCLHDATGRRFAHPAAPLSVFVDGDEADAEERLVASADAVCKHSVGLIESWAAEESRLQEALLADQDDLVAEAMALQSDILAAVDAIESRE
ncbi:MAG: hypothetical protein ACE367_20835 [Acidimicrobiales bacterium]